MPTPSPSTRAWPDSAATYAALGLPLVPVHTRDVRGRCSCGEAACQWDHPRFPSWTDEVLTDPGDVVYWIEMWPDEAWVSVGVALGAPWGVAALVVEHSAVSALRDLIPASGLPQTPAYRDGQRSVYLFAHPNDGSDHDVTLCEGVTLALGPRVQRLPASHDTRAGAATWITPPTSARLKPVPTPIRRRAGLGAGTVPRVGRRLQFRSAEYLVEHRELGVSWLAYPWVARGSITVLLGAPKITGKTTWLLDLASHMVRGTSFLDHGVARSRALFCTGQPGASFRATITDAGLGRPDDLAGMRWLSAADIERLHWPLFAEDLIQQCMHERIEIVVFDALDDFASLSDSDARPTSHAAVDALLQLAQGGLGVVAVVPDAVSERGLAVNLSRLGRLGSAADTVIGLSPSTAGGHASSVRVLEAVSRYRDVPSRLLLERRVGEQYAVARLAQHGPLFESAPVASLVADGLGDGTEGGRGDGHAGTPLLHVREAGEA